MLETRRDPTSAERFTFFENMRFKDGYLYKVRPLSFPFEYIFFSLGG
jgi:hypothetical protein